MVYSPLPGKSPESLLGTLGRLTGLSCSPALALFLPFPLPAPPHDGRWLFRLATAAFFMLGGKLVLPTPTITWSWG